MPTNRPELEHIGSLITYKDNGQDVCLGYLMDFGEKGIYDATYGKLELSPEDAKTHNTLLDAAMIEGLDNRCEIGQGNTFYYADGQIKTFIGTIVAGAGEGTTVTVKGGKSIHFTRKGKHYRGRLQKDADCFDFKRIA